MFLVRLWKYLFLLTTLFSSSRTKHCAGSRLFSPIFALLYFAFTQVCSWCKVHVSFKSYFNPVTLTLTFVCRETTKEKIKPSRRHSCRCFNCLNFRRIRKAGGEKTQRQYFWSVGCCVCKLVAKQAKMKPFLPCYHL